MKQSFLPCARLVKDREDLVSIDQGGLEAQGLVEVACVGRLVSADVACVCVCDGVSEVPCGLPIGVIVVS